MKVDTVVLFTILPQVLCSILSIYVSFALVESPPTEQLSAFVPSEDSTAILPPKYGPVDTSTSLISGRQRLALAETSKNVLIRNYVECTGDVTICVHTYRILSSKFCSGFHTVYLQYLHPLVGTMIVFP